MKRSIRMFMFSAVAIGLTACGGGGSSTDLALLPTPTATPTATPTPTPTPTSIPTYTQLSDLEFKRLELDRNWNSGSVTSKTFQFSDTYIENTEGYTLLEDELSGKDESSACLMSVEGLSETYLCLSVRGHGAATAYGISIDTKGEVSGIFDYSLEGNTYELADGLYYDWLDDGTISGESIPASEQKKIVDDQDISMKDDLERSERSNNISLVDTSDTTNNAILQQAIDDVYYILLDRL